MGLKLPQHPQPEHAVRALHSAARDTTAARFIAFSAATSWQDGSHDCSHLKAARLCCSQRLRHVHQVVSFVIVLLSRYLQCESTFSVHRKTSVIHEKTSVHCRSEK